jgi:transcriptional regulator with XRE-family HTH domain
MRTVRLTRPAQEFDTCYTAYQNQESKQTLLLRLTDMHAQDSQNEPLTFGALLKRHRREAGLSQQALADRAGYTYSYISMLERGKRLANPEVAAALATALELSEHDTNRFVAVARVQHGGAFRLDTRPRRTELGGAPHVEHLYGRERELAELEQWIVGERCRLVAVLGMGGVGKTALAAKLVEHIKDQFEYVIWHSLLNAPPLESILGKCIRFLSDEISAHLPDDQDEQIALLLTYMRDHHCLVVIDNMESVLQGGDRAGQYRGGYAGYARLTQRVGEAAHQSCLLLTSREKPSGVAHLEGGTSAARSFRLVGLGLPEGRQLLSDQHLSGSDTTWAELIQLYAGNPLALKLISEPIREVFGGNITAFLQKGGLVFGDVQDLLTQQFNRLSELEQEIMYWLAIEREPVALDDLRNNAVNPVPRGELVAALDSLRRRSLIERVGAAPFTLQPVIMEYVTSRFVDQVCQEIDAQVTGVVATHALVKA